MPKLIPPTFLFRLRPSRFDAWQALVERLNAAAPAAITYEVAEQQDGYWLLEVTVPSVLSAVTLTAEWIKLS